jgi:16S rRNA A1518/A1519 N6-dimethyltransferase RsmA/KsgA/DIM1 with predicted DNA glycosylase/AP lyase activity
VSFAQKRKKLTNNLAGVLHKKTGEIRELLEKLGINPDIRAEDLTLPEWQKLFNELR